jgi:hypothetical protein
VFHVELRKFPHNTCAFNLIEAELWEIVGPWSREQWVELGERKWSPHQARLTVLEGPRLAVEDLAMGRGWRHAQHRCSDVTERVLAQALAAPSRSAAAPSPAGTPAAGTPPVAGTPAGSAPGARAVAAAESDTPSGDSAAASLRPLLGPDPAALLQAWRLAAQRRPELTPSESLALAEATLRSLERPPA